MAAETLATFTTRVQRLIGDQSSGGKWTQTEVTEAVQEAVRDAWPHFFTTLVDSTSFTGANQIANTVNEITVPATFLGSTANGKPPALITALEARPIYINNSSYGEWYFIERGVQIDDLNQTTPKIRFTNTDYYPFELKIWAAVRLNPPALTTDVLEGQTLSGYMEYLMWQTRALLHASRETSSDTDRSNHGRRGIMAEERVKNIRRRHGMPLPHLTIFEK